MRWNVIRNENSGFGSISLTLGIISFILSLFFPLTGFVILVMTMGYALVFIVPSLTVIFGIVGLIKDNKIPMAIIGLNLGLIVWIQVIFNFVERFLYYYWI